MNFFKIYKLKELVYIFLFISILTLLLIFSKENFELVKSSTNIFLLSVLPSLFPFIFFTEFVLRTKVLEILEKFLGKIISKIFNISKESSSAVIIGFLCGFPMGSKTVANLYEAGKITKIEAKQLLCFVNNCNPAFILSTIGIGIFGNLSIGIILLLSHYISAIFIGIVSSRLITYKIIHEKRQFVNSFDENIEANKREKIRTEDNFSFFDNIRKSILNSFITLGIIFGFILIFNLVYNYLKILLLNLNVDYDLVNVISGFFEVTKGIVNIYDTSYVLNIKIYISSFMLGFSGICILCQIYSTIYKSKFSFKDILIPKFTQGIISIPVTYILLNFTNIYTSDTILNVFSNSNTNISYETFIETIKHSYTNSLLLIFAVLSIYFIFAIIFSNKIVKKRK